MCFGQITVGGEQRLQLLPLQVDGRLRRLLHPSRRSAMPSKARRHGGGRLAHQRHQGATVVCDDGRHDCSVGAGVGVGVSVGVVLVLVVVVLV